MTAKDILGKLGSLYIWGHLGAMFLTILLCIAGAWFWLGFYTHHGEAVKVPDLEGMQFEQAMRMLEQEGLNIIVTDSGYNKKLPPKCVLAQNPVPGSNVKAGRTIYVTLNSPSSPTAQIPDLVGNCSYREAAARLQGLGFKLTEPKRIEGEERDWVVGIEANGRSVIVGDMVSIETPLTLLIGAGADEDDELMLLQEDGDDFGEGEEMPPLMDDLQ